MTLSGKAWLGKNMDSWSLKAFFSQTLRLGYIFLINPQMSFVQSAWNRQSQVMGNIF